jgi:hypothetical protein
MERSYPPTRPVPVRPKQRKDSGQSGAEDVRLDVPIGMGAVKSVRTDTSSSTYSRSLYGCGMQEGRRQEDARRDNGRSWRDSTISALNRVFDGIEGYMLA